MKVLVFGLVVVMALVGGLVLGAGTLLNSEGVRGRVLAAAERAVGRPVRIGGALGVDAGSLVRLVPVISAADVAVLNGPGFSREALVSARRVEVAVALWPLVMGRVEVRSVLVDGPDLLLERDAGGRGNWVRAERSAVAGVVGAPRERMAVEVGPVRVEGGRVAGLGMPAVAIGSGTVTQAGEVIKVEAAGVVGALPVAVAAEVRREGGPVVLQMTGDGGMVEAQGVVDMARGGFEGTVSGVVPDLGRSALLLGVAAPGLREVRFSGRVVQGTEGFAVRGMQLKSAQGDVAGDLALVLRPRLAVRGSLVGQQWKLDEWRMVRPAVVAGPVGVPPVVAPVVAPVVPGRVSPFEALRRMDGDLQVAVGEAVYRGVTYRDVQGRAVLQEGRLRVDPVRVTSPAGAMEGQLTVDAGAVPPSVAVMLHAPGLEGAGLASVAGVGGAVTGSVDVEADLRSSGGDWGALLAGVSGRLAASLVEGEVDNALLARLFGAVLRSANIPVEAGGRSHVRCIAFRGDAVGGQVRVGTLVLDTTRLRVEGDGTVDLPGETMDLHLRPTIRIGGAGVSVPVRVSGPFGAPRAAADKGVLAPGRFGISIAQLGAALSGGGVDICGPALAAVRESGAGR